MQPPLDTAAGRYPRTGLLAALRDAIRNAHYSLRTERAYVLWTRRFVAYHRGRSPRDLGAAEVTAFLTSLAVNREVAAATQNHALAAILRTIQELLGHKDVSTTMIYTHVLNRGGRGGVSPLDRMGGVADK